MSKNIRWLQYSIGMILLLISIISIFNYKVDSSGVFGHSNYLSKAAKALTSGKMIAGLQNIDDRLFQDLIIKNLQVRNDIVAIGSSTTMQLRKGVFLKDRNNFFNHSVNGASLEDYIAIVGAYESTQSYLPSNIILGVDSWVFNKNNGQGRWVGLKKYYDYELDKIYSERPTSRGNSSISINSIKWKQLINFDYTVSNIKFFIRALLKDDEINAPLPSRVSKRIKVLARSQLKKLSDSELILKAIDLGVAEKIVFGGSQALDPTVPSYEKELTNREELIDALEIFTLSGLTKLSDSELILKAIDLGVAEKIVFGGSQALDPTVPSYEKELANRDGLIEELAKSSVSIAAPSLMIDELKFYVVDTVETDDFIRVNDGSIYYPNKIRYKSNSEVKDDAIAFAKNKPYSLGKYDNLHNIKLFEDFVRYLKVNKVEVTIFLPPYNPITYDLLLESNKYNMILTAEKYLINFAKLNNLNIKGSYNPHKYEFTNDDFFDGVHGRDRVFKKIFEQVRAD
jgi:hypothetical protein